MDRLALVSILLVTACTAYRPGPPIPVPAGPFRTPHAAALAGAWPGRGPHVGRPIMVVVPDDPPLDDSLFVADLSGWGLGVAVVRDTSLQALASVLINAWRRGAYLIAVRQVTVDDLRAMADGRTPSALRRFGSERSYSVTYIVEFDLGLKCGWATWPVAWVTILRDGAGFKPHAVVQSRTRGGVTTGLERRAVTQGWTVEPPPATPSVLR